MNMRNSTGKTVSIMSSRMKQDKKPYLLCISIKEKIYHHFSGGFFLLGHFKGYPIAGW